MDQWIKPVLARLDRQYGTRGWTCVLATADGVGKPTARVMTLRQIDEDGTLLFVSDRRTRKDAQIRSRPDVEVVFWLPQVNCQIRLRGQAVVVGAEMDDYMRSTWWAKLDDATARNISGEDSNGDHQLPGTFELIVVVPDEVDIDDYQSDGRHSSTWCRTGSVWQSVAKV